MGSWCSAMYFVVCIIIRLLLMSIDTFATINEAKRLRMSARHTWPNKLTKKPKAKSIIVR